MKLVALLLCALAIACTAASAAPGEKKPFVMYAQLMDTKEVELSDGSVWLMDKGDCFPIHMFKDRQTIVVLELAGAKFALPAFHVRVMKDHEKEVAEASYQQNVDNYWKAAAKRPKAEGAEKAPLAK